MKILKFSCPSPSCKGSCSLEIKEPIKTGTVHDCECPNCETVWSISFDATENIEKKDEITNPNWNIIFSCPYQNGKKSFLVYIPNYSIKDGFQGSFLCNCTKMHKLNINISKKCQSPIMSENPGNHTALKRIVRVHIRDDDIRDDDIKA